jgi:hypothetical protein
MGNHSSTAGIIFSAVLAVTYVFMDPVFSYWDGGYSYLGFIS